MKKLVKIVIENDTHSFCTQKSIVFGNSFAQHTREDVRLQAYIANTEKINQKEDSQSNKVVLYYKNNPSIESMYIFSCSSGSHLIDDGYSQGIVGVIIQK